jgi:hypothetical protein
MRLMLLLFCFVVAPPLSATESLGRLFFSPHERALLDSGRKQKAKTEEAPTPAPVAAAPAEPPPPPPPLENLSINGVIKRSDGTSTVWVNGKPVNGKAALSGGRTIAGVGSGGRVAVRMQETKRHVELKVGQHLDASSGAIRENLSKQPERLESNSDETEELSDEELESTYADEPNLDPDSDPEPTEEIAEKKQPRKKWTSRSRQGRAKQQAGELDENPNAVTEEVRAHR